MDGCFILYDLNKEEYIRYNSVFCDKEFLPASTFKIPHSLIALQTGVIPDTSFTLEWDGFERSIKPWNKNHKLKSAIQYSVVWFFKEIAKRIGEEEMQKWIDSLKYGNQNLSGQFPFWLNGNLRITPNQQIEFLKKFYYEELPFAKEYIQLIKNYMLIEKTSEYELHAKTGWADSGGINVGWIVGYLEKDKNVYLFSTLITKENEIENFAQLRFDITNNIFSELGLITPKPD